MILQKDNCSILSKCQRMWPKFTFAAGLNSNWRYCVFIYDKMERGTNLPAIGIGPIAELEFEGGSEKDFEVLLTKVTMVCGTPVA